MGYSKSASKDVENEMLRYKRGTARSGPGGKGGKVKSRKQAIAIAIHESGISKYASASENKRSLAKSKRKEARGETGQQEKEGKSHVGARGMRDSSRAMGGKSATLTTRRGKSGAAGRSRAGATHERKSANTSGKHKAS
jgi:hypothetical protein